MRFRVRICLLVAAALAVFVTFSTVQPPSQMLGLHTARHDMKHDVSSTSGTPGNSAMEGMAGHSSHHSHGSASGAFAAVSETANAGTQAPALDKWIKGTVATSGPFGYLMRGLPENPLRPMAQTVDVTVGPNGLLTFSPATITINVGDTVRWTWASDGHDVASGMDCQPDNKFCDNNNTNCASAPILNMGDTYSHTFNTPGVYSYICLPHCPGMKGTITVQSATTSPASLQFSAASYSVNEGDPTGNPAATITVTRTGDTSTAVSVDFATSDGTASQKNKYTTTTGTLTFASGETSKTFSIPIIDEAYVEGNQTVNLTLSNPTGGAVLGAQSTAVLTIIDNDTSPPTTNPIDDAHFFVRQHYLDFLSRTPDQSGWDYWTGQINNCGTDPKCINGGRINVSAAYFTSLEFQDTGFFVYLFYIASFGQKPTYAQFLPDRARVVGGANLDAGKAAFATSWVQRADFLAKYPSTMTAAQFVDALIQTVKMADGVDLSSQRNTLISMYDGTDSGRAAIVRAVVDNADVKKAEFNPAFVLMQYFGYLRRDPDTNGFNFWLQIMNGLNPTAFQGMTCAFITSIEYQDRFSSVHTRTNSTCGQ